MSRIVRPMIKDPRDGFPLVDARSRCLGVRPPGPSADVDVDAAGNVQVNRKGMSVSADWRLLPGHLIPEHLDDGTNDASGKRMAVFVHGMNSGAFSEGAVAAGLELCFKSGSSRTGNVCPIAVVPLTEFQGHLAATRSDWVIDES